jgi:hypothetical protein
LNWSWIHFHGDLTKAKLALPVHAPGPEHISVVSTDSQSMILSTGNVMQSDPLEANNFGGNSYIRAVLMMLALLNIVKTALLTDQIVHESVKA